VYAARELDACDCGDALDMTETAMQIFCVRTCGIIGHVRAQDRVTKLQEQAQQQKRRIEDLQRALATANQAEEKVWFGAIGLLLHDLRRKNALVRLSDALARTPSLPLPHLHVSIRSPYLSRTVPSHVSDKVPRRAGT
jgi:GTP cyclohydrolase II